MIHIKKLCLLMSAVLIASSLPTNIYAEDADTHTVTVLDFDGNVIDSIEVGDGEALSLDGVDTDSLEKHLDVYTQIGFNGWSSYPEKITEDITVRALYVKMTIALESLPDKVEYYSENGEISLDGLEVTITAERQLPEQDEDGNFKTNTEVVNIESTCTASPSTCEEAFADGDNAVIEVYPVNSNRPIASYNVSLCRNLGDVNSDSRADACDASAILGIYSDISTGVLTEVSDDMKKICDVNRDGMIDAADASLILQYYINASVSSNPSWDDIL